MDNNMVNGFNGDYLDNPVSDSNISTTNGVDIIEESEWELAEADELDVRIVLYLMIVFTNTVSL